MKKSKSTTSAEEPIQLPPLKRKIIKIPIIGDSPLICHRFSDRSKRKMLDRQMKKATSGREVRNPEQEYEESLYVLPDGSYGFPASGFKSASVSACRQTDGMPMTKAKGAFHVLGEYVKIKGKPRMREDMVRLESGVADLRYRAEFPQWSTEVTVAFNESVISAEQLINLFELAGFAVGVGDWRPGAPKSATGSYGTFHVARGNEGEQKKARR